MPYNAWNGVKLMVVWYEVLYQNSASGILALWWVSKYTTQVGFQTSINNLRLAITLWVIGQRMFQIYPL